jgi:CubicO group peptidase (beta-lactamase class C family)
MRKHFGSIFVLTVVLHAAGAHAAADPASIADRIDAAIGPDYKADAPGATVIVVKDGKTVFRKAYGLADLAARQPLTPDTALRIGSITKQFTAAAILMLAEEGKLSVGDEITRYLPDFPTHGRKITIEHLLTHTSGIPSYTGKPDYMQGMGRDMTVAQMIDGFKDDPLEFEPGSQWRYDNSGYFLLGAIIEKMTGMSYADFLQQRIFTPLGMTHTAYEGHERTVFAHAVAYSPGPDGFQVSPHLSMTQPYAAGALVSSVDDLARWDAAIAGGKLLKAASWQRAFTPYTLTTGTKTGYGYGWEISTLRGRPEIAHGGAITGFRAFALRLPEDKVYVAVLSNADGGVVSPDGPAHKAAAIAIGKPFPDFKPAAIDPRLLDAYAGLYRADAKANWTVRRTAGGLALHVPHGPLIPLQAFSETGFYAPGSVDWVEFKRDKNGAPTDMVLHRSDSDSVMPRAGNIVQRKAVPISHAAFDARAGRYAFPQGLVIELTREGDRLFAQAANQPKLEIFALGDNAFFSDAVDAELRIDPADPVNGVVLDQGGQQLKGKKIQ